MRASLLSRVGSNLALGLVVLTALYIVGSQYSHPTFKSLGLDWWTLPSLLRDQALSDQAVRLGIEVKRELAVIAPVRDRLLGEIIDGKVSVADGLNEFRSLCQSSPSVYKAIQAFYPAATAEESMLAYFACALEHVSEGRPEALAYLLPELEAVLGVRVQSIRGL